MKRKFAMEFWALIAFMLRNNPELLEGYYSESMYYPWAMRFTTPSPFSPYRNKLRIDKMLREFAQSSEPSEAEIRKERLKRYQASVGKPPQTIFFQSKTDTWQREPWFKVENDYISESLYR